MPKILRIINRLNLGGPTFNVAYLSKYLTPKYETLLVSGQKDDTEESSQFILDSLGLKPLYLPNMKREISWQDDRVAYKKIKEIINDYKPDIVHTHAAKSGAIGRLAAHSCKVPVIAHTFHGHVFHSYFSPLKTRFFIEVERYLAKKSSAIVAISQKQKEELTTTFKIAPEKKIHIVKLGFDLEKFNTDKEEKRKQFRQEYLINEQDLVITITGRFVPIKNHTLLLQTIEKIKEQLPNNIRFFIVGDGELKEDLLSECNTRNLPYTWFPENKERKLITFTSWKKDIDVVNAGSDIIVLCSHNEGTPVSLIEAQASGKPIISSNVGGVLDVVSSDNGLFFNSNNVSDFCEKLLLLINNRELQAKMSNFGWEYVKNEFHYQRLVNDMDKLYQHLLSA